MYPSARLTMHLYHDNMSLLETFHSHAEELYDCQNR